MKQQAKCSVSGNPIVMTFTTRTIPTTTYTNPVRPWILDYYSWLSAPDSWENANLSWDSYGSWPQATTYGERIIPNPKNYVNYLLDQYHQIIFFESIKVIKQLLQ